MSRTRRLLYEKTERIFAEFRPSEVDSLDETSSLVHFNKRADCAAMILEMTTPMRRIRGRKTAEEGEVMESDEDDEEEGQIKREQGDNVTVVDNIDDITSRREDDYVEINIDRFKVPKGRWRVVTQHVPANMLILVRFPTIHEVDDARSKRKEELEDHFSRKRRIHYDDDGYSYKWQGEKTRPGLNVFNEKGEELDWDYEHDTRFYEDKSNQEEKETIIAENVKPIAQTKGIKVRGRGTLKGSYLYGSSSGGEKDDSSTLNADNFEPSAKKRSRMDKVDEEENSDVWRFTLNF
ncbi:hypothetical protein WR25_06837 isoform A [Diploscapter pachys]|uniref:Uncharacterized protein n=2 Tax=Diploscapter pachys TaxID=2018661 RepID=A0A2A2JI35_9BILA|nr:hypothetical protein WR25_06837 isoform A [Diploscapter pachys]